MLDHSKHVLYSQNSHYGQQASEVTIYLDDTKEGLFDNTLVPTPT